MNSASPAHFRYAELAEGQTAAHEYHITESVYAGFLTTFDDRSPIHVDRAAAQARGFADCVMHGAILHGFLSHFIGMVFPGGTALVLSTELRHAQPAFLDDRLTLTAKIAQKVDAQRVIVLHLRFTNETRGGVAATGRAQVQLSE